MTVSASPALATARPWKPGRVSWSLLALFPLGLGLLSLTIGRFEISVAQVLTILGLPLLPAEAISATAERVILLIRLPRVLEALTIGAGLGITGTALQGVFRNPLVGPQIIGVSTGAAFGGTLAIFFGLGLAAMMGTAFVFGLLALSIVFLLARVDGRSAVLMLVLAGVVVSAFFGALVSLLTYLADPNDSLPAIVYWLMGSFAAAAWPKLGGVVAITAAGGGVLCLLRFRIDVLSLGDEEAQALGVPVEGLRWAVLLAVTAIVSAGVAVAGVVGWVGLVVPHLARMLVGPDHRLLLPASALVGAGYMVLVDTVARSLTVAEIPLGILTAIIGAPVFAWLLRKTQAGGWKS